MATTFNGDYSVRVETTIIPTFAVYVLDGEEVADVYFTQDEEAAADIDGFNAYGFEYVHSTLGIGRGEE